MSDKKTLNKKSRIYGTSDLSISFAQLIDRSASLAQIGLSRTWFSGRGWSVRKRPCAREAVLSCTRPLSHRSHDLVGEAREAGLWWLLNFTPTLFSVTSVFMVVSSTGSGGLSCLLFLYVYSKTLKKKSLVVSACFAPSTVKQLSEKNINRCTHLHSSPFQRSFPVHE